MMENPGRWIVASIALVVLSLVLVFQKSIPLGADLKGGTRLVYQVPFEKAKQDGTLPPDADLASTVQQIIDVMMKRVDVMGLREITIVGQGTEDIVVELPGLSDAEITTIKNNITSLGKLEFRLLADHTDPFDIEREKRKLDDFLDRAENKEKIAQWEKSELAKDARTKRDLVFWVDLLRTFNAKKDETGPVKGLHWFVDSGSESFLRGKPKNGPLLDWTPDSRKIRPYFRAVRMEEALDPKGSDILVFRGVDLTNTRIGNDQSGGRGVHFEIVPSRRSQFADFTGNAIGRQMGIILNDQIDSAPSLNVELSSGAVIESSTPGGYPIEEAKALLTVLESGSLKIKPRLESEARMGASLGEDSIRLGILSSLLAVIGTVGFILLYYRVAGIIAALSLIVNGSILLGVLSIYNATLTLPGIGGFILTLAMAVDSNILIYERIREELDRGRGIEQAVRLGFERAFFTIVDSNLTTLITALILYWIGTGPIKGLGLTLSVGILTTLFASLVFTKAVFGWLLHQKKLPKLTMMRLFKTTPNLRFMKIWKLTLFISVATSIAGLVAFFGSPESVYGIDFVGGATARVQLKEPITLDAARKAFNNISGFEGNVDTTASLATGSVVPGKDGFREFVVKGKLSRERREQMKKDTSGEQQDVLVTFREGIRKAMGAQLVADPVENLLLTPGANDTEAKFTLNFEEPVSGKVVSDRLGQHAAYLVNVQVEGADAAEPRKAFNVNAKIPATMDAKTLQERLPEEFSSLVNSAPLSNPLPETATIAPRAAKSLKNKALLALILSFAGIILYIRFRFHEYRYGIGGVVGIIHDLVVTLGVVAIANLTGIVDVEIDMTMIAVFLTIAGYSINDTIVIFDRIRENLDKPDAERKTLETVVDESCNQTLSRTLLTSTAAFMSSAFMFFINRGKHNPLEGFGFTMMVGIASGTYSSIWVASLFVVGVERFNKMRGKTAAPHATNNHPAIAAKV
ncbi:MAG: protein translocase subunit SecD [Planctomycetota bacterium]